MLFRRFGFSKLKRRKSAALQRFRCHCAALFRRFAFGVALQRFRPAIVPAGEAVRFLAASESAAFSLPDSTMRRIWRRTAERKKKKAAEKRTLQIEPAIEQFADLEG